MDQIKYQPKNWNDQVIINHLWYEISSRNLNYEQSLTLYLGIQKRFLYS